MEILFKPLHFKASHIAETRLAESDGIDLILAERTAEDGIDLTRLSVAVALQQNKATPEVLTRFSDMPGWDVAAQPDKTWRIVSYRAGSAIAPLVVKLAGGAAAAPVDPSNGRGVFMFPRFVRHSGSHPAITAVNVDDKYRITLYLPQADGHYSPRQPLTAPNPGILQDARLVALDDGYLLLAQRFQPGESRKLNAWGETTILRTGLVEGQRLDSQFNPVGPVWHPFGGQPVLQFDADALGGRVAVFACTLEGWQLSVITAKDIGHTEPSHFQGLAKEALSSPSVLTLNSGLALSLLANASSEEAGLWLALIP